MGKGLTATGHRIFLDLKFYDIPNTVAGAANQTFELGVEWITAHLSGGKRMFDGLGLVPKVLGVSVLTSFSGTEWNDALKKVASEPFEMSNRF